MDDRSANAPRSTAAAVVLIALAAAGITATIYLLEPPRAGMAKVSAPPKMEPAAPRVESGVVLLADETLVAPPPAPLAVEKPAGKPPVKPAAKPAPKPKRAPAPANNAKRPPSPTLASASQYAREESRPRHARSGCITCAKVVGISEYPTYWEVRVRFNDGSRDALTYRDRPPFEIGEAVRMEHGRLYRD